MNLAPVYRGGERQTELLIRELSRRGHPQRLVIKRGSSLARRCANVKNLEIREVAPNPLAAGLAVRGSRLAHAHDGRTVYSAWFAKWYFGIPYVITRRVVAPQSRKLLRAWAYRRANSVVAISQATADALGQQQPEIDPVIVPDANAGFVANPKVVAEIRGRWPGKTLNGHIGVLDHSHKGQSTIIEAAREASASHPDWQFVLCGNGKHEARFRDEIGDLKNIELVGWIENVGDYLASFDVFVYPSLHEALGSTLLDAMQVGLPIAASNVGGIPDLVEDGVNGSLLEPENSRQLVAAIGALLADEAGLQDIRQRNRDKSSLYGADRMGDAYLELYEAV